MSGEWHWLTIAFDSLAQLERLSVPNFVGDHILLKSLKDQLTPR